jgi:histidinol-phosphate aminotransferase
LYRTLAELQGARFEAVPFTADWQTADPWPFPRAQLTFLPSPNSPSGTVVPLPALERLAQQLDGPLILDEAYVAFADADAMSLSRRANVIVTRSLSKSHALAGIRFGYAVADPSVVRELVKVKDSYNCDCLSLAAAAAALEDADYLRSTVSKILATRARLALELAILGFDVCPSQANFLWCRRTDRPVKPIYEELKRRLILIRYMQYPGYGDGLRISIGTDAEIDKLLEELRRLL